MKKRYPVFLVVLLLFAGLQSVLGNTFYVNDNSTTNDVYTSAVGSDGNVGSAAAPFATIAYAISQAFSGDTIYVDVGSYHERFTISKSLVLLGAKAGVDARTRSFASGESILDGTGFTGTPYDAIKIANNIFGVVIDGFEIRNYGGGASLNGDGNAISSYCMSTNTVGANNVSVLNNYIHDNAYNGILVGSQNVNSANTSMVIQYGWLIQYNKITNYKYAGIELTNVINSAVKDNDISAVVSLFNDPGDAGVAIEVAARSRAKPSAVDSVVVSGNSITGSFPSGSRAAINLLSRAYSSTSNASLTAIDVLNNTITSAVNVRAAILAVAETRNTVSSLISDLDVLNNTLDGNYAGFVIQDYKNTTGTPGHNTITVSGNFIKNHSTNGVYVSSNTLATGMSVQNNSFESNTVADIKNDGTDTVAATCNWYDSSAYAYIQTRMSGLVKYIPYLTDGSETDPSPGFQPTGTCDGYPIHVNGSTYGSIQDAIDNESGKRINISSGVYDGNVDATGSGIDVSLLPGNSPGCVTVNGNLSLNSGDSLIMDIDGTTACTQYDQWTYNGTVSLGNATLFMNLNYAPAKGDTFLILSNDGSDAISGQFAEGSLVTASYNSVNYYFSISYTGGDGNDVVLTLATVHNITQALHYTTIQSAVTAASAGDQILIDAGMYRENVSINKRLEIRGVGNGSDSLSNTIVYAKNSGTATFAYSAGGTDAANRQILKSIRITGARGGTGNNNSGILITSSSSLGHFTYDSIVCTGNTGHGLVANFSSPTNLFHDVLVSNDTFVSNGSYGIRTASHSVDSLTVSNSFFLNNASVGFGMNPSDNTSAVISNVSLQDVDFSGNNGTADFYAFRMLGNFTVSNVDFLGSAGSGLFGLYVLGGYLSETAAPIAPLMTLNNVNFSGAYTSAGLSFLGYSQLDSISLNNVVLNTSIATADRGQLRLSGVGGNLNLGNTAVNGTSPLAIRLNNNFNVSGSKAIVNVDATNATFNGLKGSDMTLSQLYDLETKIRHGLDSFSDAPGIVRVRANNLYITPPYGSIQRGIDSSASGDTVNISGGAFTGNMDAATGVNASKDIYFNLGASPACDTLTGNMVLNSGDTLKMDVDGTTPCTGYDQYLVNGTVTLGGATLDMSLGYTPSSSDVITLIDNDGTSDAVTGTFSQGSLITVGGYTFSIQYNGGDGNDVVLYLAPSITCPSDTIVGNDNGVCTAVVNGISPVVVGTGTSVTYVVTGATSASGSNDASGTTFNKDTSYVKYIVTDAGGNSDSCTFRVVVLDTTAPLFTSPADTILYKNSSCVADTSLASTGDVLNESDNCNAGLQATYRDSVLAGSCQGAYTVKRIWSLVDSSGNAAPDQIQTITVLDSTAPTFTRPNDTTLYKNSNCIADTSVASAGNVLDEADNCSAGLQASYRDSVVGGSCQGAYTVKRIWSLVDSCGNAAADQIQTITVLDSTSPTFTKPNDTTLYKNSSCSADTSIASTGDVTDESDNCSTGLQASYRDSVIAGTCQGTYTVKRIWSLADSCGNAAADQIQTINVLDNTAPTFTRPNDTTLYKDGSCSADTSIASTGGVTDESDNCSTGLQASYRDSVIAGTCQGTYTVKRIWSLADSCGNAAADQIQTISVLDNTAPTFTRPNDTTLYKDGSCSADTSISSTGDVTDETDNCSSGIQASYRDSVVAGSCQGTYTVKRIWSLIDSCGNAASDQIQTISVLDSTAPTFTKPNDTTLYKNASCIADTSITSTGDVTDEADNCSSGIQATYRDSVVAGSCQGSYTIKRIWSLIDSCGNAAADQIQTITVLDTTRPVITSCPGNATRKTTAGKTYYQVPNRAFDATATDNCSQSDSITYRFILSGAIDSTGSSTLLNVKLPFGTTTVKWLATDACGNTSDTCIFTVNVDTVVSLIGVGDVNVGPSSSQQYSDSITLSASVAPWPSNPADPSLIPSGKIVFYLGSERMGEAIVSDTSNPADEIGEASITVPLLELQSILDYTRYNAGQPTNGPLKPGPKFLTAVFVSFNPVYEGDTTTSTDTLHVTKENAIVRIDNSDGYFTVSPTTYKGMVWFRANVSDTNDVPLGGRGDIRNATIQFLDGSSYPSSPINGSRNVGLLDPNDKTRGQALLSFEYTLNNTEIASGGKSWLVWAQANNYYTGYDNSDMNIVTLGMPGSEFVTGGGHYIMELSGGTYSGATGKKMNFGFNMKWNKSGKNLQGKINIIYRRVVDGQLRIFHIKSNAIGTLAVSSTSFVDADGVTRLYSTALMTSQATLTDITDPDNPIGYGGNNNLKVVAWDNRQSGSAGEWDKVAVELLDGKTSQLLFSSYLSGGTTRVRTINGGNVNVRNTNPIIPPACTQPSSLFVDNITNSSAILHWSAVSGLRDSVEYRVQGSATAWTPASVSTGTGLLNISSLQAGTIYEWRVMTICTDTTRSVWSNGQFTTTINCTDAPTGLMTSAITSSSATLKWAANGSASSYFVEYRLLGSVSWDNVTVSTNYYNMSGLNDDTTYEWRVTNVCSAGTPSASDVQQFITPSGCVTGNLLASNITVSSARLHWDAAPSATGYNLRWKESTSSSWNDVTLGTINYYDLSTLNASTEYGFQVQVVCSEGDSEWADTAVFTTLAACGTPAGLQTTSITSGGALLKWTSVPGALSYTMHYRILNDASWTDVSGITSNSYSLSGLNQDTTYEWGVSAICSAGTGYWSSAVAFKTLKTVTCTAPAGLTATTYANKTSALLSWTGPVGANYTLQYKKTTSAAWTSVNTATTSQALNLSKNTTYKWQVTSYCGTTLGGTTTGPDFTTGVASVVTSGSVQSAEITMLESSLMQLQVKAYPNPTTGNITLSMTGFDEGQVVIRVIDIFGKTVMNTGHYLVRGRGTMPMQLGSVTNGVYLIQVSQKDKVKTLKLLKN